MAYLLGTKISKNIKDTVKYIEETAAVWQNMLYSLIAFSATMLVMFWISVFLYATFYLTYLPQESVSWPVHLLYKPCSDSPGICSTPNTMVEMTDPTLGSVLARGQKYRMVIDLDMPESLVNQQLGMFQIHLKMQNQEGEVIRSSTRSTMLRYKSSLHHSLATIFFLPLLLHGIQEQMQTVTVEMFTQFEDDMTQPLSEVLVEVQSKYVEIYSARLRVHAEFSGLRYIMHNHPAISAGIGISIIMSFLVILVLLSWYQFTSNSDMQVRTAMVNNIQLTHPVKRSRSILSTDKTRMSESSKSKQSPGVGAVVEDIKDNDMVNEKQDVKEEFEVVNDTDSLAKDDEINTDNVTRKRIVLEK